MSHLSPTAGTGRACRRAGKSCCVTYLLLPLKLLNFSEMRISENCESFQWRESFCDAAGFVRPTLLRPGHSGVLIRHRTFHVAFEILVFLARRAADQADVFQVVGGLEHV